jgi:hypothetical protein
MSTSNWRKWLCGAILVSCLSGCRSFFTSDGPPHDPLFLSKTPMSARVDFASPVAFAYLEPTMPKDPFLAENPPVLVDKNGPSVPGTLTNRVSDVDP